MTGEPRDDDACLAFVQSELSPTVVRWALEGNGPAMDYLVAIARTVAIRYCRARIGRREGSFADADGLARQACLAAFASLWEVSDRETHFLAVVYRSALRAVGSWPHRDDPATQVGRVAALVAALPVRQRETLVLRTVVGMSTVQAAQALGWRTRAVRDVEREALTRLRSSLSSR
ncbi:MAG TPA: sigma factor-like helix-turn-helix DNA-binding protein [Pseudonocardiaceae bacterium]|nr:sigma factor-like helix-turn-helix DNA-binding protein [Pseudonocardiaceae bacterium]